MIRLHRYMAQKFQKPRGKAFSVNRELNRQLAILAQTAKIRKIPVIITSQVRAVFDEQNGTCCTCRKQGFKILD